MISVFRENPAEAVLVMGSEIIIQNYPFFFQLIIQGIFLKITNLKEKFGRVLKKVKLCLKINYSLSSYERPKLETPNGEKKLLLHSCCAPCAGEIMEALVASNIDTTIFFYNPNIHPIEEYELRKEENVRFAKKLGMPIIDADYDRDDWFKRTKGQENEPERGKRCTTCFDMRFERTARYAAENNFDIISSTLGISRWKDMNQINDSGARFIETA